MVNGTAEKTKQKTDENADNTSTKQDLQANENADNTSTTSNEQSSPKADDSPSDDKPDPKFLDDVAKDPDDEEDDAVKIEPNLRQDLKGNDRPFEKKGSVRGAVILLGIVAVVGFGVKSYRGWNNDNSYGNRQIPTVNQEPVDYSAAPQIDYEAKYIFKDQQLDLENFKQESEQKPPTAPQPEQKPQIETTPVVRNAEPVVKVENKPKVDAISLYAKATSMGSYGISTKKPTTKKPLQPIVPPIDPYQLQIKNFDKQLPIGSKTKAILIDTIATLDLNELQDRNFIVKLIEHLVSPSNEIILPAGTQITVKVERIHPNGYLKLRPELIQMISESTRDLVKTIPPNSIVINAHNGELLKARVVKPSTMPAEMVAALFSGVTDAANLINRPESISYSTYGDGFSQSIENGAGDVGVAVAGGFSRSMSGAMQRRAREQKQKLDRESPVFILKAGTEVEIYVNQAFSL